MGFPTIISWICESTILGLGWLSTAVEESVFIFRVFETKSKVLLRLKMIFRPIHMIQHEDKPGWTSFDVFSKAQQFCLELRSWPFDLRQLGLKIDKIHLRASQDENLPATLAPGTCERKDSLDVHRQRSWYIWYYCISVYKNRPNMVENLTLFIQPNDQCQYFSGGHQVAGS